MRILHSGNLASVGRNLCVGLRRKGALADLVDTLYANRSGLLEKGDKEWTRLVDANRGLVTSYLDRLEVIYGMRLTRGLHLSQYDIFHFHHVLFPVNMGLAVRNILGNFRPVILHFHGSVTSKAKGWSYRMRSFLLRRNCEIVLCSTPNILENIRDLPQRKRFLPNPVDTSSFRPRTCTDELSRSVLCWVKLES
ncbi:MAG: glycosyltransferase family 4 protein, partial [Thermoplasmata archaeon]